MEDLAKTLSFFEIHDFRVVNHFADDVQSLTQVFKDLKEKGISLDVVTSGRNRSNLGRPLNLERAVRTVSKEEVEERGTLKDWIKGIIGSDLNATITQKGLTDAWK